MIRVGTKEIAWKKEMTVTDLLRILNEPYPYSVVRIDNKVVCRPNFNTTKVPDNAEIFLVPLVAGG